MRTLFLCLFILYALIGYSQADRKKAIAVKTDVTPIIDGSLEPAVWSRAKPVDDFIQHLPLNGLPPSFPTEVRILYDNQAIFIGAFMKDPYPDSIPMQLGNRDDENMNVDFFGVEFDTYNNQLDGFTFIVTAAGVQIDSRESDETYDGVWKSAVKKDKDGWTAEMRIPYSAIRFPNVPRQTWGMQLIRSVRRYRETDFWANEKLGAENDLIYWGELNNIENIEPPLRLSVTPYMAFSVEHYPDTAAKDVSTSFSGGMDLKYGINESFTIDMTLLPDFSQVQSDNKIKNLTAFETVYSEQRPFFKEAVDLFEKGDLFYSRRIGKLPERFYDVNNDLTDGEKITKNPVQQHLVNATKLSGRTNGGLAIGILNAVTANTYAVAENTSGEKRKILTDPASNYNMIVLAQALKNNSEAFISNTNLIRSKGYNDANVTAAGIKLNDRKNTYLVNINGGLSQNYSGNDSADSKRTVELGYKAFAGIGKTSGNFLFSIVKGAMSPTYDANGMGVTLYNNYHYNYASVSYNLYQPWWIFRDMDNTIALHNENNYNTGKVQTASLQAKSFSTTLKYLSLWLELDYSFLETYDYYEPRIDGRYFLVPKSIGGNTGFSSDYRKTFALDGLFMASYNNQLGTRESGIQLHPIYRVNDHLILNYVFSYDFIKHQVGYANSLGQGDLQEVVFGKRNVTTVTNTISGKYLFTNNISLNLNARHYWSKGEYNDFYTLLENGHLESRPDYTGKHDFNFNAFTVDMVFSWIFSPGSSLNLVWKNAIDKDGDLAEENYMKNLKDLFDTPQHNIFSIKVLYYLGRK